VAEQALARELAQGLGLLPVFVPVSEQRDLTAELNEGRGDVIVASLTLTPRRGEQIAFTRPIRFVDQVVVVRASPPRSTHSRHYPTKSCIHTPTLTCRLGVRQINKI
jgi:ABC-type amino acid transport substrate-binding protein